MLTVNEADGDGSAGRAVRDGILDQVGQHLRQEFAVAIQVGFVDPARKQAPSMVLRNTRIGIDNIKHQLPKVDRLETQLARAGLDLGYAQQGVEGRIDPVAFGKRFLQQRPQGCVLPAAVEHFVHCQLQPVERRLEVMGDVGADLPHAFNERGEPFEGLVDLSGDFIDVIPRAGEKYTHLKLAIRDRRHRRGDRVQTLLCAVGEIGPRREGEQHCECACPAEAHQHDPGEIARFLEALSDGQPVSIEGVAEEAKLLGIFQAEFRCCNAYKVADGSRRNVLCERREP